MILKGNVMSGDMAEIKRFDYLDNWISEASIDNYFRIDFCKNILYFRYTRDQRFTAIHGQDSHNWALKVSFFVVMMLSSGWLDTTPPCPNQLTYNLLYRL